MNTDKRDRKEFKNCHIAQESQIIGDVTIGEESSVFWYSVIRGDNSKVEIGHHSNLQENCTIHVEPGGKVSIGDYVTVGHGAILHGCTIGNESLIGMGSVILDGAEIVNNCLIGASSLVTSNTVIPDGYLAFGNPCKVRRPLTEEEKEKNRRSALSYAEKGRMYFG